MTRAWPMLVSFACLLAAACASRPMPDDSLQPASPARVDTLHVPAPGVDDAPLRVRVFVPSGARVGAKRMQALYINDGQDMEAVGLEDTLRTLAAEGVALPLVVAIDMPRDRMGAYGLSDRAAARSRVGDTRYGPVGTKAHAYSEWVAQTLVPSIDARYRTVRAPRGRAVLGWSLGALHAFGMAWEYPDVFGTVGAFSPSFWVPASKDDVQGTRLAQALVSRGPARRGLRMFVAVGTDEETDDRDGDGTIDAVDDARDLVAGDAAHPGLRELGYRVALDHAAHPARDADVAFALVAGGRHDQTSWKRILPEFLRWAYGTAPLQALPDAPPATPLR